APRTSSSSRTLRCPMQPTMSDDCGRPRSGPPWTSAAYSLTCDPAPLGARTLDRIANGLNGEPLTEIGIPRTSRPSPEKISKLGHATGPRSHAPADRPPTGGIRMTRMLSAYAPHPEEPGGIGAVTVLKLVETCIVEAQGAP